MNRALMARHERRGFTMVELLVVVGLILFLMSISMVALRNAIGLARQRQTEATILKVHGLLQQRIDAYNRAIERTNLQPAIDKMKRDWFQNYKLVPPDRVVDVMVRKQLFQSRFPQNFAERNLSGSASLPPPSPHSAITQSSALLYWILTSSEIYGVAPVDDSSFSSNEVRDTDGDGLLEFIDGWGKPLRFYRCPTHLFRCGDASNAPGANGASSLCPVDPQRIYARALWSGLPASPTVPGELDPLTRDPEDPTGQLWRFVAGSAAGMQVVQNLFETPNTYHSFLIVSAGPDGKLGLCEPFDCLGTSNINQVPTVSTTWPSLAIPVASSTWPSLGAPQGRLGALDPSVGYVSLDLHPINDNVTNRNR